MTPRPPDEPVTEVLPQVGGPRHRLPPPRRPRRALLCGRVAVALIAVLVVAATGIGWSTFRNLTGGITTSDALTGATTSVGGDQNILIMGLDSRLDQHGNPLPQDVYDALHAGDETVGGYNANVLILLHVPGGDGPVTAVSIPRDDYVPLHGCPSGECQGKIKQAYGLAYQETMAGDPAAGEQVAREAGRKAEISTISDLLRVPVDHFIEVTLGAFFQIAEVVQPITVCFNDDTADDFSGADFHRGVQQIDAAQAMAFVRQRRDLNNDLFTDLDRTRRQQAFIVSLVKAMRDGGALSNPAALRHLAQVAKQNVAVDAGFDVMTFVDQASALSNKRMSLYTLPIGEFGRDPLGQDVNIVDVPTIRSIVRNLFATGSPNPPASAAPAPPPAAEPAIVNVVNATGHEGLATAVSDHLSTRGFTRGDVGTADALSEDTVVEYGPGADQAAAAVADELPIAVTAEASDTVPLNTVLVTVGSDYPADEYGGGMAITTTTPAPAEVTAVDATAAGTRAPMPTDLTEMSGDTTPCVR
ncbi:LCP family protein [Mycolicibacterium arenosum]|uniref:LCP family protein n=1 Tax=Mycolicibacterium arenosum TaxID=2952157 RepID=A0ABT1M635_9MYCO|nr:LCP family protein [Mycolicibacterium sp. CAU 1645]MCP9274636.1 LCP family protein [Mycolicibacterium sp. CAU 1645]